MSEAVRRALSTFALPDVPEGAYDLVARYFELRARWSSAHNLSGPAALRDPLATDLADAAALARLVDLDLPLLDVGSGSGVPGLLVAILRPGLRVTAVEPLAKRAAFLRQVAAALALDQVSVLRDRWPLSPESPSQVVSRAVFPVASWPRAAAAGGGNIHTIHRYLARERPAFGVEGFELRAALDYEGPSGAQHRLESWSA